LSPGDAGALAAALARVLDDPAVAARLSAGGRHEVEAQYSWAATAARHGAAYAEALAR
jgi:glycosyltransferase involved in cell wall biosynthesis